MVFVQDVSLGQSPAWKRHDIVRIPQSLDCCDTVIFPFCDDKGPCVWDGQCWVIAKQTILVPKVDIELFNPFRLFPGHALCVISSADLGPIWLPISNIVEAHSRQCFTVDKTLSR